MKELFFKTLAAVMLLMTISSCDDYLSENPDNRVELNTTKKAAQLLTNAYSSAAYTFTEWMGDNVNYTQGTFLLPEHIQAYIWDDVVGVNQDTPTNYWEYTYDAIAHANEVLAIIDGLPGSEAEKNAVKAEALLTRAYGHFMLVNLFGRHYDRVTSSKDLGVPYVTEPETVFIKTYKRNTVKEVYEKVEQDLLDGLALVNDNFYANSGKYHFTRNAALAFASRFYLFKGDFPNCVKYSSEMIGADRSVFVKDLPTILATYTNTEEFLRRFTAPTDQSNLLLIRQVTNYPVNVGFWPSIGLINALYISNNPWTANDDLRRSDRYPLFQRGTNGVAVGKYEFLFERTSLTSDVGLYYTIMPAFRGEEVLLNRAESLIILNRLTEALADLQAIVDKRFQDKPTVTLTTLRNHYGVDDGRFAAFLFTLDERRREFIHEGLRWFDIKRYGIPVDHDLEDGSIITLDEDDLRQVLQIPQAAMDVGGLAPNPR